MQSVVAEMAHFSTFCFVKWLTFHELLQIRLGPFKGEHLETDGSGFLHLALPFLLSNLPSLIKSLKGSK